MPRGAEQTRAFCKRAPDDRVRDVFCADDPPAITNLVDLMAAFDFYPDRLGGLQGISMTAHSTALSARSVSAINPRLIAMRLEAPNTELLQGGPAPDDMLAMGFARGEQFVEVIVRDRVERELRFYVIGFEQACNRGERGCTPGALLTPAIERDWESLTVYDEMSLRNTVMDCAPCHQPDGPDAPKMLRMQELQSPWSHWFFRSGEGGKALFDDYMAAKGDEPFAGLTQDGLLTAHPGNLTMLVAFAGHSPQPNEFPSLEIEDEVKRSTAEQGGNQPMDNSVPGQSETWRTLYEAAQRGEAITVPYHDVKVTDPGKLARMTEAYQAFRAGELAADALPDIRDIYPDDPTLLAHMGVMTEPGLDGRDVLMQACAMCHNGKLDQSLSRAKFRADLVGMDRAEKDLAIERLRLPASDPRAMPPARLRVLSDKARERAIEALLR